MMSNERTEKAVDYQLLNQPQHYSYNIITVPQVQLTNTQSYTMWLHNKNYLYTVYMMQYYSCAVI